MRQIHGLDTTRKADPETATATLDHFRETILIAEDSNLESRFHLEKALETGLTQAATDFHQLAQDFTIPTDRYTALANDYRTAATTYIHNTRDE
ncbi:hypothetical protein, partial [Catenulispora pinistramenti]